MNVPARAPNTSMMLAALSAALLCACADDAVRPDVEPLPDAEEGSEILGTFEITLSARTDAASSLAPQASALDTITDGELTLTPVRTGSFTHGARGAGGVRYLYATYEAANTGTATRKNITFVPVEAEDAGGNPRTIAGTPVSRFELFDGTVPDTADASTHALAAAMLPTGRVHPVGASVVPTRPDVLQVFTEAEAGTFTAPAAVTNVFPYGFVVRTPAADGRTLAAGETGTVTFAYKLPLQATSAEDPFRISVVVLAVEDTETTLTQSLEEQTPDGTEAAEARMRAIGAGSIRVLPGSAYDGDGTAVDPICSVRTAGTAASPTAHLVSVSVDSVTTTAPLLFRPGATVPLGLTVHAAGGGTVALPAAWSFSGAALTGITATGTATGVRRLGPAVDPAEAQAVVTASACGRTSAPDTVRASGIVSITAGADVSVAVRSDGTVAAWGTSDLGATDVPSGLDDVIQVPVFEFHTLALRSDGSVVAFGSNIAGESDVPPGLSDVVQVSAGRLLSLALKGDGTVVAWGSDVDGRSTVPAGLDDVVQVDGGYDHALALKSDGTVVAWGANDFGQATVPVGLDDVVEVAAGTQFSLALKADGTVVAWGRDDDGQTTVPGGLTDVIQVAAGSFHALALTSDGDIIGWGNNFSGELDEPAGIAGAAVQIAAGNGHSAGIGTWGGVVAWGDNSRGETDVPSGLEVLLP